MVTDEEYRKLLNRVDRLEKTVLEISKRLNELIIHQDANHFMVRRGYTASSKKRDTTRYLFLGNTFCKRRLVLACIKRYVFDHPGINGHMLIESYPDYIQGSLGVVRKVEDAEKYNRAQQRFFFADEDILVLKDGIYVVCSQWDQKNISHFLSLEEKLGYQISKLEKKY